MNTIVRFPTAAALPAATRAAQAAPDGSAARCPIAGRLAAWWRRCRLDPLSAYLSQSSDHVDLERRMQAWEAFEGRANTGHWW